MSYGLTNRVRLLGPGYTARVSQWLNRSQIKSVQRGIVAGNATATITAVVMANSVLRYIGKGSNNDNQDLDGVILSLTDPVTVTATVQTVGGGVLASFEVIEYQPGVIKSVQRGTMASNTTQAITVVNVNKSQLDFLGTTTTSASLGDQGTCSITLTNGTTITSGPSGGLVVTVGWQVVEWF